MYDGVITLVFLSRSQSVLEIRESHYFYFTDWKTEAQRSETTCARSLSRLVVEPGSKHQCCNLLFYLLRNIAVDSLRRARTELICR